jgi:hypothetical protein
MRVCQTLGFSALTVRVDLQQCVASQKKWWEIAGREALYPFYPVPPPPFCSPEAVITTSKDFAPQRGAMH